MANTKTPAWQHLGEYEFLGFKYIVIKETDGYRCHCSKLDYDTDYSKTREKSENDMKLVIAEYTNFRDIGVLVKNQRFMPDKMSNAMFSGNCPSCNREIASDTSFRHCRYCKCLISWVDPAFNAVESEILHNARGRRDRIPAKYKELMG